MQMYIYITKYVYIIYIYITKKDARAPDIFM